MSGHTVYTPASLRALSDGELISRLEALVGQERESTADIVEHLMELDRRELAIDRAYPSIFIYCTKKLGYSEAAAFNRIRAARAAARFPDVLNRIRSGTLHLDSIARLSKHLDEDNHVELLDRAAGASKDEVLALVAQLQPEPGPERDVIVPVQSSAPKPPHPENAPPHSDRKVQMEIVPPPQHRFHFTADSELLEMVERLRGLLRHKIPDGRLENIFKEAAKTLLANIEREKSISPAVRMKKRGPVASAHERKGSRVVPRTVRRAVWTRDGGRCAYTASDGRRCESRDALEYDHIVAWADGGRSDTTDNIRLLCRAHNQRLGRRRFGATRRS